VKLLSVILILVGGLVSAPAAQAGRRPAQEEVQPVLTWDVGAASGSYGGAGYSEVNLGVNWHLLDYLVWRNAVFGRFISGASNVFGLDTSLRFQSFAQTDDRNFGIGFFAGPGYRFSQVNYTAAFLEGGLLLKLGGLNVGVGAKEFYYSNPGTDIYGRRMSNSDTVVFFILAGGGAI
jgi:hypothetical protein